MRWIREHRLITALIAIFLVLVIIFTLSVLDKDDKEVSGVENIANKGINLVSGGLSSAANTIRESIGGLFAYKQLQAEIAELRAENDELRVQLSEAKLEKEQLEELQELSAVLNYDYTKKKFKLVSADVTSYDGANHTNIFSINVGTESGIETGDAVVNGMGLIGKIQETGEGWSKVVSIIDDDSKVSFKLAIDTKQLGVVSGNSQGEVSGYMLDSESTVSQGDTLITSGLGTYPAGLEIGTVREVVYNSDTLLKELTVETAANFKSLQKVSVII